MTEADILREEYFKKRELRASFIYQAYLETHKAIWEAEHERAREVLFGDSDDTAEIDKKITMLKEQFFIRTKREFDEVDRILS